MSGSDETEENKGRVVYPDFKENGMVQRAKKVAERFKKRQEERKKEKVSPSTIQDLEIILDDYFDEILLEVRNHEQHLLKLHNKMLLEINKFI